MPKPSFRYPWIVVAGPNTDWTNPGECLRCGQKLNIPLPQNLTVWAAAALAFVEVHSRCKWKAHA